MNMREETVLMEHIKDQVCFVSQDVRSDLAASRRKDSPYRCEYVLPDGVKSLRGYIRTPQSDANQDTGERTLPCLCLDTIPGSCGLGLRAEPYDLRGYYFSPCRQIQSLEEIMWPLLLAPGLGSSLSPRVQSQP